MTGFRIIQLPEMSRQLPDSESKSPFKHCWHWDQQKTSGRSSNDLKVAGLAVSVDGGLLYWHGLTCHGWRSFRLLNRTPGTPVEKSSKTSLYHYPFIPSPVIWTSWPEIHRNTHTRLVAKWSLHLQHPQISPPWWNQASHLKVLKVSFTFISLVSSDVTHWWWKTPFQWL